MAVVASRPQARYMTTEESSFAATISRGETGSDRTKASVRCWRSPRTLLSTR